MEDTIIAGEPGPLLTSEEAERVLVEVDRTITVSGVEYPSGQPFRFSFTDTAESQRRSRELADWWRECEYAGILGIALPPPPPWRKAPKVITGIVCEPAKTRRRDLSPFSSRSRH